MNLKVTIPSSIGDIELKNPLMPAAATLGNLIEHAKYFDLVSLAQCSQIRCLLTAAHLQRPRKYVKLTRALSALFQKII